MSGNKRAQKGGTKVEANDTRLRYHLTSLYALRPIPDDLMDLVREIGTRASGAHAGDGD